ncbi:hypothetical protein YC2023_051696 [Brassica napus]
MSLNSTIFYAISLEADLGLSISNVYWFLLYQHKGLRIVMKLMKKGTDHHNQEKKDHEIGLFSLDVEAMEAEIEKLVVTKTRENQENDKEISISK